MRKILIFIGLFCALVVSGQGAMMASVGASGGAGGYTAKLQTLIAAWDTPPAADTLAFFDKFTNSLDTAGLWDKGDFMFVLCNKNSQAALIDWFHVDSTVTPSNSPTFTPYEGYTMNGTDSKINSGRNLSEAAASVNDVTFVIYSLTNNQNANPDGGSLSYDGSGYPEFSMRIRNTSDNFVWKSHDYSDIIVANTDSRGLFGITRRGANDSEAYADGASIDTDASAIDNEATGVFQLGTISGQVSTNRQYSFFALFSALSDTEHEYLNTIVKTLHDDLGLYIVP